MCNMVVKPSTEESQLSMVEMMSVEEMVPDYFVSHVSSQSTLAGSDCLIGSSGGARVHCNSWLACINSVRTRCSAARRVLMCMAIRICPSRTIRIISGRIARLGSGFVPST